MGTGSCVKKGGVEKVQVAAVLKKMLEQKSPEDLIIHSHKGTSVSSS